MKCVRYIFTILLVLFLFNIGEVLAMNTGFSTETLPEDDINSLLKNINISILADKPSKKTIECFDVNDNGAIAIGCNNFENKTVCIYTSDGVFQYGYSFECDGKFGVKLDNDVLNIYFVRGDIAIAVNLAGEVDSALKIRNTSENNSYWNNCVFSTKRKIGDTEYTIKNDMGILNLFASSYSKLVTVNKNGVENIIYDVGSAQFSNMIAVVIVVFVFVCIAVAGAIWQFIKLKNNT